MEAEARVTKPGITGTKTLWVSYGGHTEKTWHSREVTWPKMAKRLMRDFPTAETMHEWQTMNHETQTAIKSQLGGWIGGKLINGRRDADVVTRSILALDVDEPSPDLHARVDELGFECVMHPTHTPGRWRLVFPLERDLDPKPYKELVQKLMDVIPGCDPHSLKPAGIMFWPTRCADSTAKPMRVRSGEYLSPAAVDRVHRTMVKRDREHIHVDFESWSGLSVDELLARVRSAPSGERNETLNRAVYVAAASGLMNATVETRFAQAAYDAGLGRAEVSKTIASAKNAGSDHLLDQLDEAFGSDLPEFDDDLPETKYRVQWASATEIEEPRELWHDLLPLGALTIISGMGGIGKSTLDAWLAAKASNGEMDGDVPGKLKVLMVMDEDDWGIDTVPRLMAAGANLANVGKLFIKRPELSEVGVPTFPTDTNLLQQVIEENGFKLVVLDVVTSMMAAGMDTNKQADVRLLLNPLLRVAQETECAIVAVNHWRKQGGSIAHMISGSAAYRDTARCIWGVMQDPETGKRLVKIDKYNRSVKQGCTYEFNIESRQIPGWTKTVGAVTDWRESTLDAQNVLDRAVDPEVFEDYEAAEWLAEYLEENGPSRWADIKSAAREDGFTETQTKAARNKLRCFQQVYGKSDGSAGRGTVLWALPKERLRDVDEELAEFL